jgi:hypothetical protein
MLYSLCAADTDCPRDAKSRSDRQLRFPPCDGQWDAVVIAQPGPHLLRLIVGRVLHRWRDPDRCFPAQIPAGHQGPTVRLRLSGKACQRQQLPPCRACPDSRCRTHACLQTVEHLVKHISDTKPAMVLLGLASFIFLQALSSWRRRQRARQQQQRVRCSTQQHSHFPGLMRLGPADPVRTAHHSHADRLTSVTFYFSCWGYRGRGCGRADTYPRFSLAAHRYAGEPDDKDASTASELRILLGDHCHQLRRLWSHPVGVSC